MPKSFYKTQVPIHFESVLSQVPDKEENEVMEECHESSEGASVNANQILRNWGRNMDRRLQAGGPY